MKIIGEFENSYTFELDLNFSKVSCTSTTITSVLGTPLTASTTSIVISGTTVGCTSGIVNVTIQCPGQLNSQVATVVGGNWSVTIISKCLCGSNVLITATCPDTPPCTATFSGPLPCNCCPIITTTILIGPCDVNGNRPVTFTTTVTSIQLGCMPIIVERNFGDSTTGAAQVITTLSYIYTETHPYAPGNYTSALNVLSPAGCAPSLINVSVPPCPITTCCPTISAGISVGNCDVNGNFTAIITVTVTVPLGCANTVLQVDFGDTTFSTAQSFGAGTTTYSWPSHTYNTNNAPYTALINVITPSGCPGATLTVNPPNTDECDCTTTFLSWFCPLLFGIMTFGFGFALICLLLSTCSGLSTIANALLIASAVFAAIAIIALIFYVIFCNKCLPCGWWWLLFWRIFYGVGVLYAIFAACCGGTVGFLIGLGIMAIGILFLILWANLCNKTTCEIIAEILLTNAVYIFPALAFLLSNFSLLAGCLYYIIFFITFLLVITVINAILLVYYIANC